MRAVVTRVASASVTIAGEVVGEIGRGFLVLLGVGPDDTEAQADKLADKIVGLRVFEDENEKMNLNLSAVGGRLPGGLPSSPCMPIPRAAAPALPARPSRMWPSPFTSGFSPPAAGWVFRRSTGALALICRSPPSTTDR